MNTETIDKVAELIDGLCEKLGTTAQYLIPELAKMNIASEIYNIILWTLITVACCIAAYALYMKYKRDEDEWIIGVALFPIALALIGVVTAAVSGSELVKWISSPTAKAIMTIMNKIKG